MEVKGKVFLNKGREEALLRFHPWVFSGAVKVVEGKPVDGDIVEIYSESGLYLGSGHTSTGSIMIKVFHFGPKKPEDHFVVNKIKAAYSVRENLIFTNQTKSNAYRLVFSEGDGLPGLIIDYYNGVAVVQAHSTGMYLWREQIVAALKELYGKKLKAIYDKSQKTLSQSGFETSGDGFWMGNAERVGIMEHGHHFMVDFRDGQKTGFFLDQRDNRKLLSQYASGRKVLNLFSYTGGYSIYALKAGASEVVSVDASGKAMQLLDENLLLNNLNPSLHKGIVADAKDYLKDMDTDFDLIVLDPPAFAKHQADRRRALQGYRYINSMAIKKAAPGGLIFTFSCSQAISNELFASMLLSSAIDAGRQVRLLHHLGHSADHPVSVFHPEGEYLKGAVLQVH